MARTRILLADDHQLVLEGFRKLLDAEFDVVGTAQDGHALLAAVQKLKPQVVVLDISLPLLNGIECARRIRKEHPQVKVVFLTMHANPAYVEEAFRVGASAYLLKNSAASELPFAIGEALLDRCYLTPLITRDMISSVVDKIPRPDSRAPRYAFGLTPRQTEVLQLVAEGRSNKEVAALLNVTVKAVEFHKSRIMDKLNLRTTAELTRYAVSNGIVAAS